MPGGQNTSKSVKQQKPVKPGQSVQTLLAAKISDKPVPKRPHSEVSNDSNTSLDISGLINFQKDLDEIKFSLRDVTTKDDLDKVTRDLVKTSDLEEMVTGIVKKLFSKFESTMEKKLNEKLTKMQNEIEKKDKEMNEKIEAISIENENLQKQLDKCFNQNSSLKQELTYTTRLARSVDMSSNYNEQYSRKNNIKVFHFPRKENQNLRKDFIELVKNELNVTLTERDVVAIHRLPSPQEPRPLIVKCFNTDVKRSLMRVRKELSGKVKFVDDVTTRNMRLITRLEDTGNFDQVWYFNCNVYARTMEGLQLKFNLYDDINQRLREAEGR